MNNRHCRAPFLKVLLFLLLISFYSCNQKRARPDVSSVEIDFTLIRFEKELFNIPPGNIPDGLNKLSAKYPGFYNTYVENILKIGSVEDSSSGYLQTLESFVSNEYIRGLNDTCQAHFPDMLWLEKELKLTFKYLKYHFPDFTVPVVYTFISEFGPAVIIDSGMLGIGLDRFLGTGFKTYGDLQFMYNYIIKVSTREHIIPLCVKSILKDLYMLPSDASTLIDYMVHNGKMLYLMEELVPGAKENIVAGYTKAELAWCKNNQVQVWAFFIEHDLLYESEVIQFSKYVTEGATTANMPPESPGNVGSYIGWEIIRKFMRNHPNISFKNLMEDKDLSGQELLTASKYKPKNS